MLKPDKWIRCVVICAFLTMLPAIIRAQTSPQVGIRENPPQVHAFINAKIVTVSGAVIPRGTLVFRNGVIQAVGAAVNIPPDARVWDLTGKTVYPGLIESYSHLGLQKKPAKKPGPAPGNPTGSPEGPGSWNKRVHPQLNAADKYRLSKKELNALRAQGITVLHIVPPKGIFRGNTALLLLEDGPANRQVMRENVMQALAFERGSFRERGYPGSLMGAIALIRQTLLDADWYRKAWEVYNAYPTGNERPETNEALAALAPVLNKSEPVLFEVSNDLNFLRASKIAAEFNLPFVVKGSGYEYRKLPEIRQTGFPVIAPLNFSDKLNVERPEDALDVSLAELQHWELAPENPARLANAGIRLALTADGLKKPQTLFGQIRKAIEHGLSEEDALRALTLNPARILNAAGRIGSIAAGKIANFVVTDGDLFAEKTHILDVWVDGRRYPVTPAPDIDPRGVWKAALQLPDGSQMTGELKLSGEPTKLKGSFSPAGKKISIQKISAVLSHISFRFAGDSLGRKGFIRMTGRVEKGHISGNGLWPNGESFSWNASLVSAARPDSSQLPKPPKPGKLSTTPITLTPGAFARTTVPSRPTAVLVRNATIWTSGPKGVLKNADLLVVNGKIKAVGKGLKAPKGSLVIDGAGKQVTPGLIDAHSHTAISSGVNEAGQAVTAEVRIGDVINSNDIAIYRELAGGLTVINQLHGSANPIGGQNSVIKLRWGADPDGLKFKAAPPGIKFALGENVKQSNWGDNFTTRYPQTRLGVDQIIRDRLRAAREYEQKWQKYRRLSRKQRARVIPPRRDLELETLVEVLNGKRLVHSHSYRQDEILMLIRVADDFGFTIGTFQHVLEGYKIAEAIKKHGAGASTFSDWWAYKFEVYDAIPYNGALMDKVGVVVSFNSDSGELARRLNTEAAKAVKYGGLAPEEALKFVTINPAKQLHIDRWVGSLEPGKDADFVIWNGDPLSIYTRCEQTWIDGRKYFDRREDEQMRRAIAKERARLVQKYLAAAAKKKPGRKSK